MNVTTKVELEQQIRETMLKNQRKALDSCKRRWSTEIIHRNQNDIDLITAKFNDMFKVSISTMIEYYLNRMPYFIFYRVMVNDEVEFHIKEESFDLKVSHLNKSVFQLLKLPAGEQFPLIYLIDYYYYCLNKNTLPNAIESFEGYFNQDSTKILRQEH